MNLKSVLLSAPIRVGGAPAAKRFEASLETMLSVEPPFVVVGVRKGDVLHRVGVPAVSVQMVEFVDAPVPSTPTSAPSDGEESAKGKKGKG